MFIKNFFTVLLILFSQLTFSASQDVSISWTPPTTRADGTALSTSDLAGYEIYYTTDVAMPAIPDATNTGLVSVSPGSMTTKVITLSLAPRTTAYKIYFAMSAIDTAGRKSALSNLVVATLSVPISVPGAPLNLKVAITCASNNCTVTIQ